MKYTKNRLMLDLEDISTKTRQDSLLIWPETLTALATILTKLDSEFVDPDDVLSHKGIFEAYDFVVTCFKQITDIDICGGKYGEELWVRKYILDALIMIENTYGDNQP